MIGTHCKAYQKLTYDAETLQLCLFYITDFFVISLIEFLEFTVAAG